MKASAWFIPLADHKGKITMKAYEVAAAREELAGENSSCRAKEFIAARLVYSVFGCKVAF